MVYSAEIEILTGTSYGADGTSDIIFIRGNDVVLQLTVTDDGDAANLTGHTLHFYVKKYISEADGDAVIHKYTGSGISAGDTTGIVTITLDDTDTDDLEHSFFYIYDVELILSTEEEYTLLRGVFLVKQN